MPDTIERLTSITKIAFTSKPSSEALEYVLYISNSCLTLKLPGTKPDCKDVIALFIFKKLKIRLCMIFPITFPSVLSNEIGL